jgi:hypothetical protein
VSEVYKLPLEPCALELFTGGSALAVAYSGRDMIQVQLLPVEMSWLEIEGSGPIGSGGNGLDRRAV